MMAIMTRMMTFLFLMILLCLFSLMFLKKFFLDTFVMKPNLSPAGLTFVVKFKYDRLAMKESDEKFIIDSGGWLGHGISLFVLGGELTAVVSSKGHVWVVG